MVQFLNYSATLEILPGSWINRHGHLTNKNQEITTNPLLPHTEHALLGVLISAARRTSDCSFVFLPVRFSPYLLVPFFQLLDPGLVILSTLPPLPTLNARSNAGWAGSTGIPSALDYLHQWTSRGAIWVTHGLLYLTLLYSPRNCRYVHSRITLRSNDYVG